MLSSTLWRAGLIATFLAGPACPWGREGHRLVARIAAQGLTAAARQQVAILLGVEPNRVSDAMADASTWPDEINKRETKTGEWHYIDIELIDSRNDFAKRCPTGDCITVKLNEMTANLRSGQATAWSVADQLRFVIHFVGDMHQPLHASDNSDHGGNCVTTNSSLNVKNLHALWDYGILERTPIHESSMAKTLGQMQNPAWLTGTFDDWAWESHILGIGAVYGPLLGQIPISTAGMVDQCPVFNADITPEYMQLADPLIHAQLAKAGARLAKVLNDAFSN